MNFPNIKDFCNGRDYAQAVDLPIADGQMRNGEIYLANDNRFTESTFSQPLTTYAVGGWAQNNLDATLTALVGTPVLAPQRFTYKVFSNVEAFRSGSTEEDRRAIGSEYKAATLTNSEASGELVDRGLIMALDKRQLQDGIWTEQKAVDYLLTRLKINQIRRAHALLVASATNTAKTWLSTFTKDPDTEILTEVQAYHTATGIYPNTVVLGKSAALGRLQQHRNQATAGAFAGAQMSYAELATMLGVRSVSQIDSAYQSSATAKTVVGNSIVLVHHREESGLGMDPSNIRYFYGPTPSGQRVTAFRYEVGSSQVVVGVQHYELMVIPYTGGIRTLTIS